MFRVHSNWNWLLKKVLTDNKANSISLIKYKLTKTWNEKNQCHDKKPQKNTHTHHSHFQFYKENLEIRNTNQTKILKGNWRVSERKAHPFPYVILFLREYMSFFTDNGWFWLNRIIHDQISLNNTLYTCSTMLFFISLWEYVKLVESLMGCFVCLFRSNEEKKD